MTLNGVMAFALRYFTAFGKPAFQHFIASISGGIYMYESIVYFVVRDSVYDVVVKKVHVRYLIF